MTDERQAGLREAVEDVLTTLERVATDSESQHPGGWGPDVTTVADLRDCQAILRAALAAQVPAQSEGEALLAECAEVCTSGCHADDCEHHGHLPAERQVGLREALERHVDATARRRGVQFKLSHSEYHVPAPAVRDWLRAALAAQVPAQELDALDIDAMAAALELRDVQRGGSPHITPHNQFYREEAAALLACLPPRPVLAVPAQEERLRRDEAHALGYREGYRAALAAQVPAEEERLDVGRLTEAIQRAERRGGNYPSEARLRWLAEAVAAEYRALGETS